MSKANGTKIKINGAKNVKMDENLSSLSGTIVANDSVQWTTGNDGIPTNWVVDYEDGGGEPMVS